MGLILIEGLLSVDNALAIAAVASHLDEKKRRVAMNIGYIGAYGFRVLALLFASYIIDNHTIKFVGALYLVWLMCAHFAGQKEIAGEEGEAVNVHHRTFAGTITMIALMDLSLSVDNVVAAIALSERALASLRGCHDWHHSAAFDRWCRCQNDHQIPRAGAYGFHPSRLRWFAAHHGIAVSRLVSWPWSNEGEDHQIRRDSRPRGSDASVVGKVLGSHHSQSHPAHLGAANANFRLVGWSCFSLDYMACEESNCHCEKVLTVGTEV